jgi:large subunit ribosomal protein L29
MSASELRELSEAELDKRLQDARQELFNLRLQRASGKLLNPARVALARRTVARLLTVMRERNSAGEMAGGGRASWRRP